jgi:hypothetical protein
MGRCGMGGGRGGQSMGINIRGLDGVPFWIWSLHWSCFRESEPDFCLHSHWESHYRRLIWSFGLELSFPLD